MKIVFISDTHGLHEQLNHMLPEGDVIVHSGDFTNIGYSVDIIKFCKWFAGLPYKHKIFIAGNHELYLDPLSHGRESQLDIIGSYTKTGELIYLEDSEVVIDGIKFYGSPYTPEFYNWAFMQKRGFESFERWEKIPLDTDVLITHGPPHQILDKCEDGFHAGCEALKEKLLFLKKLKVHVFGHIHEGYGIETKHDVFYLNASSVNAQYKVVNVPLALHIPNKTGDNVANIQH